MYAADIAERDPERVALIQAETGETRTFQEFENAANRVAHLLRDHGMRQRDRIAVFMENCLPMVEVQGGAERTGLYYTLVSAQLTASEAAYIINDCRATVVFTTSRMTVAVELPALCPDVERWIMVDAANGPFENYATVTAAQPGTPVADEQLGMPLSYSSGTTGKPKGVLRPMRDMRPSDSLPIMKVAPGVYRMHEQMVFLLPAPLYHSGPHNQLTCCLRMGGTTVVMGRFQAEEFLRLVERYKVTHTAVVPTMFSRLLALPEGVRSSYDLSSLEIVLHGAAPCPPAVKYRMIDWVGPILFEYFGTTESNGSVTCTSEEWLAHPGTVGRPVFGEIVILDDRGEELPTGTIGQIWMRGVTDFVYLNDEEKTREAQWVGDNISTSGDIGYVDEDGFLYLTDRAAFTIISGGVNVYPQETENVLVEHPAVQDVAVIGVPDDDLGEVPKAIVELTPDHHGSPELEQELIEFCRARLARPKRPRSVDFVAELPRLASGKVQKGKLRDRYRTQSSGIA